MRIALVELGPSRPELHDPIGIETLAGTLHRRLPGRAMEIDLYSLSLAQEDEGRILERGYDVIGAAAKLGTWERLKALWARLGENGRRRPLFLVGDLLGTYAPSDVLDCLTDAICVRGEGETALAALLELAVREPVGDARFRSTLARVPDLAFREGDRTIETRRAGVDLSTAPPPRRDFLHRVVETRSQVQVEGSRGCPWSRCSFCSIPSLNGAAWRPVSVDVILEQFAEISDAGGRSIYFTDSDFLGSSIERAHRFADLVLQAKAQRRIAPELNFYLNLQASGIVGGGGNSREACISMLHHLQASGLREVFVGIESGAKGQVRRYAKASTPIRNHQALSVLDEMGVQSDIGFIMFDPLMRLEEILLNLDFLEAAGLWGHPSRFTKALRIQPDTGYADSFFRESKPRLNVNNLTYPYSFRDARADRVYRRFRQWEVRHLDYENLVQGASKGEVSNEDVRREVRAHLGEVRAIDLTFLRVCAEACLSDNLEDEALAACERELRAKLRRLMGSRPAEVDAHAERLGISLNADFMHQPAYLSRYRVLNTYEDPVYPTIDELLA